MSTDDSDNDRSTTEVPQLEPEVVKALNEADPEDVKAALGGGGTLSRRAALGIAGGIGAAAVGGTAGAATSSTKAGNMAVGTAATENTYKFANPNYFGGPASARTELNSVLTSDDAGAKFRGDDNGAVYHWTGSSWTIQPVTTENVSIADSVTTAKPGELQSKLSAATANDTVIAVGGAHDPGSLTTVPADVTLKFEGAWFEPTSDYNGFFVSHGASLYLKSVTSTTTYNSTLAELNTSTEGGPYRINDGTEATVHVEAEGTPPSGTTAGEGTALKLVADGSGITLGCEFEVNLYGFNKQVDADTSNGGFVQGCDFRANLTRPTIGIDHRSSGGAGAGMDQRVTGVLQPGSGSDIGIRNQTTDTSVWFVGETWDPNLFDTNALVGQNIRVESTASSLAGFTDGSADTWQVYYTDDSLYWVSLESGDEYQWQFQNNRIDWKVNGSWMWALRNDGQFNIINGHFTPQSEDLSQRNGVLDEVALHDGSDASSTQADLYRWDGTNWVRTGDTATTI